MKALIPVEVIEQRILLIRGQRVMLDADLAGLYGTTTKRLNEQVKRNRGRFPEDFMFQLTKKEKAEVVAICDHLAKLKFSPVLPNAFTPLEIMPRCSLRARGSPSRRPSGLGSAPEGLMPRREALWAGGCNRIRF